MNILKKKLNEAERGCSWLADKINIKNKHVYLRLYALAKLDNSELLDSISFNEVLEIDKQLEGFKQELEGIKK